MNEFLSMNVLMKNQSYYRQQHQHPNIFTFQQIQAFFVHIQWLNVKQLTKNHLCGWVVQGITGI